MRRMRIYSSLNLKYDTIIKDYLRNGKKMNIELVKKYINKHEINDLMNEMRMIGLELNEEEKEEIRECLNTKFLKDSSILLEVNITTI